MRMEIPIPTAGTSLSWINTPLEVWQTVA